MSKSMCNLFIVLYFEFFPSIMEKFNWLGNFCFVVFLFFILMFVILMFVLCFSFQLHIFAWKWNNCANFLRPVQSHSFTKRSISSCPVLIVFFFFSCRPIILQCYIYVLPRIQRKNVSEQNMNDVGWSYHSH